MSDKEITYAELRERMERAYIKLEDIESTVTRQNAEIALLKQSVREAGQLITEFMDLDSEYRDIIRGLLSSSISPDIFRRAREATKN